MARHRAVDVVGERDEPRLEPVRAHLPRQVQRIDRDAVAADAGTGIERHEPEGLGGGGIDHFPRVHAQAPAHERELVGERDVDVAEDVLVQLHELGHLRARDRVHARDDLPVERGRQLGAGGRDAAHDLGNVADLEDRVARIDPLRREGDEEVQADAGAARLEHRQQQLLRAPRVRGALEDDQLARLVAGRRLLGRGHDVGDVGILGLPQRRGHADHDHVAAGERAGIRRRPVAARAEQGLELLARHVGHVRAAAAKRGRAVRIVVEAGDREAGFRERDGQGKPDVTLSDHADARGARRDARVQGLRHERAPRRARRGRGWPRPACRRRVGS